MFRVCRICGKTEKETRIVHSIKYNMDLCKYHHESLSRKHLKADNVIVDNKLYIDDKIFIFDIKDLDTIQTHKWFIKYVNTKPYLIDSEGHYLLNILMKTDNIQKVTFKDNDLFNYTRDNLLIVKLKKFKKIPITSFGYKGIYRTCIYPYRYRYNITINGKLVSTKEFPRFELVVYLAYLVNKIIFQDNSYDDEITRQYLDKLTIVDRENIESYFLSKFVSIDKKFKDLWLEYLKDKKFNNKLIRNEKARFNKEL